MGWIRDLFEISALRRENVNLREQLEQERSRHLAREERLIDQVLTAAGRYGIAVASEAEAATVTSPQPQPLIKNALQEAQFHVFLECAQEEGRSLQEAIELFRQYQNGGPMPFQDQGNLISE